MDNASDYGSEDSRFDSWQDRCFFQLFFAFLPGWQSNFAELTLEKLKIPVNDDFPKHLVGFFDFYGNVFLSQEFIICPLLGYGVKKSLFQFGQEKGLPPQFKR
jgi:hypothetical protein